MCRELYKGPDLIKGIDIIEPRASMLAFNMKRKTKNTSAFKDSKISSSSLATVTVNFNVSPNPGDTMFINMRNGNSAVLTGYAGWTLLGSVASSLYTLVRIADSTDTGSYTFTWSIAVNNLSVHSVMVSGTVGYQNYLMTTATNALVVTSPSLTISKNSTMLYYFSTAGNANGATSAAIPAGYTAVLISGFNLQTTYQTFSVDTTSSYTVTFSPGTGPATTRIVRIEILGAT